MKRADLAPALIARLKRYPAPYDSHYGVVPLPPPAEPPAILGLRDRYETAIGALARLEALAAELGDGWLVSRLLARREAVTSSAIEGTNSTLDELLLIEETAEEEAAPRQQAAGQVRDYALALERLMPEARRLGTAMFTRDLVSRLHGAVMQADPDFPGVPGQIRETVVWIGPPGSGIAYSTYNPAPPEDVPACLEESLAYMRGEADALLPPSIITRMAVAHAHFEAVHPFTDGNGRVGRLLLPLLMAAERHIPVYLSPYIEAHRRDYYDALKAAQQRLAWQEMIGFIASAITATVAELDETRKALARLRAIWEARRRFRVNSASLRALDILPSYPVITTGRLAGLLGVTFPAASAAIGQLQEVGILRERTGYQRNRIFAAEEVLTVINRPFGEAPVLPGEAG
ncbi:Fic family protein [Roseomonas sp. GC11]|uniref:Fic family protein n=1 Tax=Roseomonas sp. GC11 TaxID=2950546 RepID=UPI00210893BD|nr:Fic family protein [Roseomonas sp. GC11]MCQ4159872.1 Fic family protein [Roseomonas sp. GC11]